jgi:hypothetical protein
MAERIDNLLACVQAVDTKVDHVSDRVLVVEGKVDHLTENVARLSASVDQRFDAVDAAFVQQRQYTEFAYSRLEAKMDAGNARLEARMDAGFGRVERIERKLDLLIDQRRPQRTRKPRA